MRIGSTNMVEGEILIKARYDSDHIGNRLLGGQTLSGAFALFEEDVWIVFVFFALV